MQFKRLFIFYFLLLGAASAGKAQDWMGFHSSNYAGVNGIQFQPASIADSRYKFQMNLIGVSAYASNNYYKIPNGYFTSFNFSTDRFISSTKNNDKGIFASTDVHVPLSFMLTLSPKHAIALTARARAVVNVEGISADVANFIDRIEDEGDFVIDENETYDFSNFYVQSQAWLEYGLTYSRVVFDKETSFLKAGATVKLLSGQGSGYMFFNDVKYSGLADNRVDVARISVESGISDNLSVSDGADDYEFDAFNNTGLGLDLGAVYEHRPNIEKYRYDMDGETGLLRRDRNKYKYKIGFSLLDIGGIKYDKSNDSGNIEGDASGLDVNDLDGDLDKILDSLFVYTTGGSYKMSLPTRMAGEFDYHVAKGFYINFTGQLALKKGTGDTEKSAYVSGIALTPRIESKNFGLALPISYDKYSNLASGFSLRLGSLVVGSRDGISNFLLGKDVSSADVHVALRFGLTYNKKKDKDNDGVSNKRDVCKRVPGVWAFKGCPDRDGDGVEDKEDACADVPGKVEFRGCPDGDNDGVEDAKDSCPEVPGVAAFNGCPDTDGDGVKDEEDACPELAGSPERKGCPDSDGDGLYDNEDNCPQVAGSPDNQGCPFSDMDGDNVIDRDDQCPELAGVPENGGCPYSDIDGDGVIDVEDECPSTPGLATNKGCPELQEEEKEVLDAAFDNLEFKTGSAVIATSSYTSLVELANLLKKKPEWKLKIEGHTDNTGNRATNLRISEQRAKAVADFLAAQGIDKERFQVSGFGPDQPIADNSTAEGRQKNRRVVMTVLFE